MAFGLKYVSDPKFSKGRGDCSIFKKPIVKKDNLGNIVEKYDSLKQCNEALGFYNGKLRHYIKNKIPYNGFIYEYQYREL